MVTVCDLVKRERIDKIFLMHLSYGTGDSYRRKLWNYATANNLIGLDHTDVDERFDRLSTKKRERLSKVWIHQFQLFEEMQIGDVVAIMAGEDRLLGICRVNGDYKFVSKHRNDFFGHVRPVLWLVKKEFDRAIRFHLPKGRRFTRTLRIIKHDDPRTKDIWDRLMDVKIKRIIRPNSFVKKKKPKISKPSKKKYGSAGEGLQHREFKKWISRNPQRLGLPEPKDTLVEHQLDSGECPDVLFLFEDNSYAVVEVETEHEVYRGAYQALKYKVLICAENGYRIDSDKVKAFLVAYERDKKASSICSRYGIEYKVFPKF